MKDTIFQRTHLENANSTGVHTYTSTAWTYSTVLYSVLMELLYLTFSHQKISLNIKSWDTSVIKWLAITCTILFSSAPFCGALFGNKLSMSETDNSPPYIVETKNARSFISILLCTFLAWGLCTITISCSLIHGLIYCRISHIQNSQKLLTPRVCLSLIQCLSTVLPLIQVRSHISLSLVRNSLVSLSFQAPRQCISQLLIVVQQPLFQNS